MATTVLSKGQARRACTVDDSIVIDLIFFFLLHLNNLSPKQVVGLALRCNNSALLNVQYVQYCRRKWVINLSFLYRENLLLIFKLFISSKSLGIAVKVSSNERKRVVVLMGSVQISPYGFVCERE